MSRARLLALPVLFCLAAMPAFTQTGTDAVRGAPLNINKFKIWVMNNGLIGNPGAIGGTIETFGTYPLRATPVLYSSSLLWGGYVLDGFEDGLVRVTGAYWNSGMVPGVIVSSGMGQDRANAAVRVYRIRADYATADLHTDAADVFMKSILEVTDAEMAEVRAQYAKDWQEWPWQLGAPFYDVNKNGVRDPGEAPGLAGADMVVWYAMNDLDAATSAQLYSAPPTGMEVQTTLWGYIADQHVLANSVFERNRLIFKGTGSSRSDARIDSMYLTKFADVYLGDPCDELLGSDSLLQLGYAYNGNPVDRLFDSFGIRIPPSVGYALLQGPLVPGNDGDRGIFDLRPRAGYTNLKASSMIAKFTGSSISDPPFSREGGYRAYRWMRGFQPTASGTPLYPYRDPNGVPTRWCYSADPRIGKGAIDGLGTSEWSLAPGCRRFLLSAGPFTMALGDTQEVVWALVGADGQDRLGNTYYLKWFTKYLQEFYPDLEALKSFAAESPADAPVEPLEFRLEQNFPNPFNPTTTIHYSIAGFRGQASGVSQVRLAVYDLLGREVALLVDGQQAPGEYSVKFSASGLASGMYFYRLQAGHYMQVRKMMIVR